MGRQGVVVLVLCSAMACGPEVRDRALVAVATLPMACAESPSRTSQGTWVCLTNQDRIGLSHGGTDFSELGARGAAVSGAVVWAWDNRLRRYEDQGDGGLIQTPDASYDWMKGSPIYPPLGAVVAREQEILITFGPYEVVSATADGLIKTSEISTGYRIASHYGPITPFLDLGETLWAFGPTMNDHFFCPFTFTSGAGIGDGGPCSTAPETLTGIASGGMWLSGPSDETVRLYRPSGATLAPVKGVELPRQRWQGDGPPWSTDPDPSTLQVARMEGDHLMLDRYRGTTGFSWGGATEQWVWETNGTLTRVYAR